MTVAHVHPSRIDGRGSANALPSTNAPRSRADGVNKLRCGQFVDTQNSLIAMILDNLLTWLPPGDVSGLGAACSMHRYLISNRLRGQY